MKKPKKAMRARTLFIVALVFYPLSWIFGKETLLGDIFTIVGLGSLVLAAITQLGVMRQKKKAAGTISKPLQ